MVRLEVAIDDVLWPKLKLVLIRTDLDGQKTSLVKQWVYDGAYNQFENDIHNHLRPMVEQLIQRRLGKK